MLIDVEHRMQFEYSDFVRDSQMEIRVEAQTLPQQVSQSFQLSVGPPASVERYFDWNQNCVHYLSIRNYHNRIEIRARSLIDSQPDNSGLARLNAVDPQPSTNEYPDFRRFEAPVDRAPGLEDLAGRLSIATNAPLGEQAVAVGELLGREIEYRPGVTTWKSKVADVLEHRTGVCQDFAHVALGLLRLRGIPCRYVSGYLHVGAEMMTAQSHAWIEIYGDGCGWVAYDPTHRRAPDENYITVATGRHYTDVAPNRGVYRGNATETLRAGVHTELGSEIDVVRLRRQSEGIDVPVFTELPARKGDNPARSGEVPDARRQQQQQQQ